MATLTTGHPTLRGTPVITQTLNKEQQRTVSQLLYVSMRLSSLRIRHFTAYRQCRNVDI